MLRGTVEDSLVLGKRELEVGAVCVALEAEVSWQVSRWKSGRAADDRAEGRETREPRDASQPGDRVLEPGSRRRAGHGGRDLVADLGSDVPRRSGGADRTRTARPEPLARAPERTPAGPPARDPRSTPALPDAARRDGRAASPDRWPWPALAGRGTHRGAGATTARRVRPSAPTGRWKPTPPEAAPHASDLNLHSRRVDAGGSGRVRPVHGALGPDPPSRAAYERHAEQGHRVTTALLERGAEP